MYALYLKLKKNKFKIMKEAFEMESFLEKIKLILTKWMFMLFCFFRGVFSKYQKWIRTDAGVRRGDIQNRSDTYFMDAPNM
jgi:hypothetical protein